ncbi:cytochrome P450 [Umezawaea sp. Da 62-37]|uniref:cytochrome P450 n=1 Tax=Umezawaea sp. Da 62-37 TaxID=3075927 RepID=UPI0028F731B5|nr:cytochrome P450 [Umezawaea sp. Da 62-37]WNV87400.1 cytochrome P450 [Umezawaea sp. Da 62-37]
MVSASGVRPEQFPVTRKCPFLPPAEYGEIREREPIAKVSLVEGQWAWAITRHEDVRAVLVDPRFSSDRDDPNYPRLVPGSRPRAGQKTLTTMDAPEHGVARRAVLGEFTVRRTEALRPRVQAIVDERIDAIVAGPQPADLVRDLALPVPSLVICELLGVPYDDHEFFQGHTSTMVDMMSSAEQRQGAFAAITGYLDELVTLKEKAPDHEDLLGRQIIGGRADGTHRHEALVAMAFLLLAAGHETTANMISLSAVALLENPDQLAAIRADQAKTLPAVEELLRYFTVVDSHIARVAVEDVELGGVTIRAGEGVLGLLLAANRDPEAFDDPDVLDVGRGARHHVAFGFGPHQCLGQNLARMELQVVIDTLFRRIPGIALAKPVEELDFKDTAVIYGLHSLPITW